MDETYLPVDPDLFGLALIDAFDDLFFLDKGWMISSVSLRE